MGCARPICAGNAAPWPSPSTRDPWRFGPSVGPRECRSTLVAVDTVDEGRLEWLGATIDASGDGYAALRAVREGDAIVDWIVVDANTLVRSRWSRVVGEVVGMRLSDLDAAADNSELLTLYETALRTQERQTTDVPLAVPGGLGGWRRIIAIPAGDDTVSVLTRNITRERYFESTTQQERERFAALAGGDAAGAPTRSLSSDARFAKLSALTLFLAAGFVTFANSFVIHSHLIDVGALRVTGIVTVLLGAVIYMLPWRLHARALGWLVIFGAVTLLAGTDQLHHFSRIEEALSVYPVFFIIVVAWSGLTQGRGTATFVAVLCAPVLGGLLAEGGHGVAALQCAVVALPAAAILGEVLSWSSDRAARLIQLEAARRLHDPLTGLANRTQLNDRADQALARARRSGHQLAMLFIDLDRFKQVNDTMGHRAGDELLVATAQRVAGLVRGLDTVARLGGDEFVVLCEEVSLAEIDAIASRIIGALEEPFACGGGEARIGASIGIVMCIDGSETAETMLQKADIALYRAKANGRGCYELFDEAMQQWVAGRADLDHALRNAIANEELCVHYQPIVDTMTGEIVHFEALVRWSRPGFGLTLPGDFIGLAEETGLIVDIGAWVLRQACTEAATWKRQWPGRDIGVAVNVSSRQLVKGLLVDHVDTALTASGLDARLLTLELTESSLIDDAIGVRDILGHLRERGIRVAIDDFGTGYSSLTYLRELPIDEIKIDRSFIARIAHDRSDAAIAAAVVALADNLGFAVIAEGVETREQLAALTALGCRRAQGYLFARPLPCDRISEIVGGAPFGDETRG
jgi:diguanylate cyclase (GGDEF)-like protein